MITDWPPIYLRSSISRVENIFNKNRINLPEKPSVYAFWWVGDKAELLATNRKIVLVGPGGRKVKVEFQDWWPPELEYPCLYIGKTTNLKRRFSLHIKRGTSKRLHRIKSDEKIKAATTSCQLRYGIEHVFRNHGEPLDIIYKKVGFSYTTDFSAKNSIANRFYTENRLIGVWLPWFNVDSER